MVIMIGFCACWWSVDSTVCRDRKCPLHFFWLRISVLQFKSGHNQNNFFVSLLLWCHW